MTALMSCPACQREVSTAAQACPGCGHPFAPQERGGADGRHIGGTIGKVATVAGVAYAIPWIARLIVAIVAIVVFGCLLFR